MGRGRGQESVNGLAVLYALHYLTADQAEDSRNRAEDLSRGHVDTESGHQAEDGHDSRVYACRMSLDEVHVPTFRKPS